MNIDIKNLKWIREPKEFTIADDKIEIVTSHIQICGRELIIISEMIMCLFTRKSSFKAVFKHMQIMECQWQAHDGQQPDYVNIIV